MKYILILGLTGCLSQCQTPPSADSGGTAPIEIGPFEIGPFENWPIETGPFETGPFETGPFETGSPLDGVEEIGRDFTSLEEMNIEVVTYALNKDFTPYYTDNDGNPPKFHVVRPRTFADPDAAHPVLVWLHGGVAGVDEDKDRNRFCSAKGVEDLVRNAIYNHELVLYFLMERDWIMIVPETNWCDLWAGLGDQDPTDTNHKSTFHIENILDILEVGVDDMVVDTDQYYLWGTSIGGSGVFPVSYGSGAETSRFAAAISDSGPLHTARWFDSKIENDVVSHVVGGDPYEDEADTIPSKYWDRYTRIDGTLLISERGFRVPVFSVYNSYDTLTSIEHGLALESSMETHYRPDGVRFFSKNVKHRSPGSTFHTQTPFDAAPWGYINRAAFGFLEGHQVVMLEAEDLCEVKKGCPVVDENSSDKAIANEIQRHSQAAALYVSDTDPPGILFNEPLPAEIPRGVPLELMLAVEVKSTGSALGTDSLLSFILTDSNGVLLQEQSLIANDAATGILPPARHAAQIAATTVVPAITDLDPGVLPEDVTLTVFYHGHGSIYFDAIWAIY